MTRTDWDAYSAFYQEIAEPYEADLAFLGWGMPPGLSVLEVGVGTGRVASIHAPGAKSYLGVDISAGMLGLMEDKHIENLSTWHVDFMHMIPDDGFDRVLMPYRVLHYLHPWKEALVKAWGLLNLGGMVFIDIHLEAREEEWINYKHHRILRVRQAIKQRELLRYALEIGFKPVQIVKTKDNAMMAWMEKP